jgi:hypothetical protein
MKLMGNRRTVLSLAINANTNDYNIRTAAGSPATAVDVVVTVASSIIVGNSGFPSGVAMITGSGWVTGSTITLVNNGFIEGFGGAGFDGDGGNAMSLTWPITIDNTNGYIRGGGGGGAFGLPMGPTNPALSGAGGGGAGGGQGNPGGGHSAGDTNYAVVGTDGTDGSRSSPGSGGNGGANSFYGNYGGGGGGGGAWGDAGSNANLNGAGFGNTNTGAAGKAINTAGNAVTWLGGNNSSQVKGAVS